MRTILVPVDFSDCSLAGLRYAVRFAKELDARIIVLHVTDLGPVMTSSDIRDLLARKANDRRAAEAVALFYYQAKKWIGAFAAALGGLDTLVFTGGIGQNDPVIRARICDGLGFLGIELDRQQNAANAEQISGKGSRVAVRVIRTDEELIIAKSVCRFLKEEVP